MTDEEIKKQAERIFMKENGVLVRIEFNEYPNSKTSQLLLDLSEVEKKKIFIMH